MLNSWVKNSVGSKAGWAGKRVETHSSAKRHPPESPASQKYILFNRKKPAEKTKNFQETQNFNSMRRFKDPYFLYSCFLHYFRGFSNIYMANIHNRIISEVSKMLEFAEYKPNTKNELCILPVFVFFCGGYNRYNYKDTRMYWYMYWYIFYFSKIIKSENIGSIHNKVV